jgi:mono/diheme cytochrome c family protein
MRTLYIEASRSNIPKMKPLQSRLAEPTDLKPVSHTGVRSKKLRQERLMIISKARRKKMSHRSVLRIISIILFALCALTALPAQNPTFLNQGWNQQQRTAFYTTSQGSQMMPMSWFLALEQESGQPFAKDLTRYGFLPSSVNPNGLPVGFTSDPQGGTWVGLTCAACHTNQIEYKGKTMQLDGGPTDADLFTFLAQLGTALQTTLADPAKFGRFAAKVGANDKKAQQELRNELTRFVAYFSTFLNAVTPPNPWGPARADAFGLIFNRATAIDLSDLPVWQWFHALEQNNRAPDAPVSYPYLWGVSRMDKVQWNGVLKNTTCGERLGRNVGEALGAFGRIQLTPSISGYPSTVNTRNQVMLEEKLIKYLKSPQWSGTNLPPIDNANAAAGKALYNKYCVSCHTVIDRNSSSRVTVNLTPLAQIGTDPLMATNVACRTADTGTLAGTRQPPVFGTTLKQTDYALNVAGNAAAGVIVADPPISCILGLAQVDTAQVKQAIGPAVEKQKAAPARKALVQKVPQAFLAATGTGECITSLEQYIGRPLDGIWATAPYLHNGSVPNLDQLLQTSDKRDKTFKGGSRSFDPVHVGFDTTTGSFDFDTTLPGNSNKGHEGKVGKFDYGTNLNDEQRQQLLEYLKTL